MKFLLDEQLPPALTDWLRSLGHEATHVRDVGLRSGSDGQIVARALTSQSAILTKDVDFVGMALRNPQLQVVWLRWGNLPNEALFARLGKSLGLVCARLVSGDHIIELR